MYSVVHIACGLFHILYFFVSGRDSLSTHNLFNLFLIYGHLGCSQAYAIKDTSTSILVYIALQRDADTAT